jgi:hypothetical protein
MLTQLKLRFLAFPDGQPARLCAVYKDQEQADTPVNTSWESMQAPTMLAYIGRSVLAIQCRFH